MSNESQIQSAGNEGKNGNGTKPASVFAMASVPTAILERAAHAAILRCVEEYFRDGRDGYKAIMESVKSWARIVDIHRLVGEAVERIAAKIIAESLGNRIRREVTRRLRELGEAGNVDATIQQAIAEYVETGIVPLRHMRCSCGLEGTQQMNASCGHCVCNVCRRWEEGTGFVCERCHGETIETARLTAELNAELTLKG